jgi:predicted GIY-YIG superfamily endonuclease
MTVYLLHFSEPLHHARHYLGFSNDLEKRLRLHKAGWNNDARLLQVLRARDISFQLARIWPDGDRALERRLKRQHNSPRLCPICIAEKRMAVILNGDGDQERK